MTHPLHDIELPKGHADHFPIVIEVPMGSKCKYAVDRRTGLLVLDRVLYASIVYPANYGFMPRTRAPSGDALGVLVLTQEALAPMAIVRARPIGGLALRDDVGGDDAILAACVDDPAFAHVRRHDELAPHAGKELVRFVADDRGIEDGLVIMYGRDRAMQVVGEAIAGYRARSTTGA
jgi:inorganic pyrophosphatase